MTERILALLLGFAFPGLAQDRGPAVPDPAGLCRPVEGVGRLRAGTAFFAGEALFRRRVSQAGGSPGPRQGLPWGCPPGASFPVLPHGGSRPVAWPRGPEAPRVFLWAGMRF